MINKNVFITIFASQKCRLVRESDFGRFKNMILKELKLLKE